MQHDHDRRFKSLIREFFADFLNLFFADWAERLDLSRIEWLEQEMLPDPPDGDRHIVDLVAKLRTLEPLDSGDTWLALIHIEIESPDRTTLLKPRLPRYYGHLRERHRLPVLPIVIYLKVRLDGIGVDTVIERIWELEVNTFRYLYVGLPGLEAEPYLRGDSWLGVALSALMKLPKGKAAEYGAEALRRLSEAGALNDQQRFLLGDCVEAYLPIDAMEAQHFRGIIEQNSTEGVRAMNKTRYDLAVEAGIERGIDRGRLYGQLEFLEAQLEAKFGPLAPELVEELRRSPQERLLELARSIPSAQSLAELGLN